MADACVGDGIADATLTVDASGNVVPISSGGGAGDAMNYIINSKLPLKRKPKLKIVSTSSVSETKTSDVDEVSISLMDYSKKTRDELIAICKENSIKGYSGKKRDEILALITEKLQLTNKKLRFVDLCCGIGSFHLSFTKNGMECVFACDIDKDVQETYKLNYGMKPAGDLYEVDISSVPSFDILCAGFPCQPFSNAGKHLGFEDTRGTLFFKIMEWVVYHKPKFVILENVPAIMSHDSGNTFKTICESIRNVGYQVSTAIVKCSDYGIPQMRKRMLIVGTRYGLSTTEILNFDRFKKKVTLSEYLNKPFDKDIAYTIRCGGRGSKIGDKHNWDSYIVNGEVYRLTIEDGLRLQGFPPNFVLFGSNVRKWHQLGNTIPTNFTDMIAQNIIRELDHSELDHKDD